MPMERAEYHKKQAQIAKVVSRILSKAAAAGEIPQVTLDDNLKYLDDLWNSFSKNHQYFFALDKRHDFYFNNFFLIRQVKNTEKQDNSFYNQR